MIHRAVIIQMILGQIGEDSGFKLTTPGPPQMQRVGRSLDDGMSATMIHHLAESPLQVDCIRRRVLHRISLIPDLHVDGADQTRFISAFQENVADRDRVTVVLPLVPVTAIKFRSCVG